MGQPLNSDIEVFRGIRFQRLDSLTDEVKIRTNGMRPVELVVPGSENNVSSTRDAVYSDAYPDGHKLVVYDNNEVGMAVGMTAIEASAGLVKLIEIGRDRFVRGVTGNADADMFLAAGGN